jgi:hypothetical protein
MYYIIIYNKWFCNCILTVLVDPYLSVMTDDVLTGKCSEKDFRACGWFSWNKNDWNFFGSAIISTISIFYCFYSENYIIIINLSYERPPQPSNNTF